MIMRCEDKLGKKCSECGSSFICEEDAVVLVGVLACQNYQRNRSMMVIVCAKTVF